MLFQKNLKSTKQTLNTILFTKKEDEIIKPLCITLPQMSEFVKYFYVGKKMSFMTDEEEHIAALQANKIWKKIEKTLVVKLDSNPMFEERCIKTKLKTYNNRVNTVFVDTKNLMKFQKKKLTTVVLQ